LILHKSFNIKDFTAAQGGPLCEVKAADSGRFMQNPYGRAIFWCFLAKIQFEGKSLRHCIFTKNPSKI